MTLATLLLLTMSQEPAPPELDAETCVQDPPACIKVAGAHFDAGRFPEAVRLFEALIAANPGTAKYHYFAGIAREGAGDDTAAYVHMHRFLASAADDAPDRDRATRRTAAILARTTRISLHTPKHDTPLTLQLRRLGATHSGEPPLIIPLAILPTHDGAHELALTPGEWEFTLDPARVRDMEVAPLRIEVHPGARKLKLELTASPVRHQLTLELGPNRALDRGITIELRRIGGLTLKIVTPDTRIVRRELPPGTWTYEARARGFVQQKHPITLDGPLTVPIELTSKWPEERRKRLKLGLGLAGAGLAPAIIGGVLLGLSEQQMPEQPDESNRLLIDKLRNWGDLGAASLGLSAGLWVSSISGAAAKKPSKVWKSNLAIGIIAVAGCITAYSIVRITWQDQIPNHPYGYSTDRRGGPLLAASGIGSGLGLIIGAATTAVQQRRSRQRVNHQKTALIRK